MGFFDGGAWSCSTVSVVSGEVTLTSMYHVCVSWVAMMSMMPFFVGAVGFDAVECRRVSFNKCVVSVLFDPLVEGLSDVVVSFVTVWSCFACHAVVRVCVKWDSAWHAVHVVLACRHGGVGREAQS